MTVIASTHDTAALELIDAAANRYLSAGRTAWEFARRKLRADPIYLQVLRDGALTDGGVVLDLGCGRGLMLALLAEAAVRYPRGLWPAGWPAPPVAARLHGLEVRARMAERARDALKRDAVIEAGDLRGAALPSSHSVLIFDVLHLLPRAAQDQLLEQIHAALDTGGMLIIREADADGGWRFFAVRFGNRFNAICQGRARRPFAFDSARGWQARLERLGFSIEKLHHQEAGPFANFSLYARKR